MIDLILGSTKDAVLFALDLCGCLRERLSRNDIRSKLRGFARQMDTYNKTTYSSESSEHSVANSLTGAQQR